MACFHVFSKVNCASSLKVGRFGRTREIKAESRHPTHTRECKSPFTHLCLLNRHGYHFNR